MKTPKRSSRTSTWEEKTRLATMESNGSVRYLNKKELKKISKYYKNKSSTEIWAIEFEEKLSSFLSGYLVLDSVARSSKTIPMPNALALRKKMFSEMKEFVREQKEKSVRETAIDILREIENFELKDNGEVLAYKLGASGFRIDLEEHISKKYQLRYKHQKKLLSSLNPEERETGLKNED